MQFLLVGSLLLLLVGGLMALLYRGLLMSLAVRLLGSRLSNAAKRHRLRIRFGQHEGGWIRCTLQATARSAGRRTGVPGVVGVNQGVASPPRQVLSRLPRLPQVPAQLLTARAASSRV